MPDHRLCPGETVVLLELAVCLERLTFGINKCLIVQRYTCGVGAQRTGVSDVVWGRELGRPSCGMTCVSLLWELSHEQGDEGWIAGLLPRQAQGSTGPDFPSHCGFQTKAASESPGRLVNTQIWASPSPEFRIQYVWGRAWAFAFLTNSPRMLMLVLWGSHTENNLLIGWVWHASPQNGETYSEARARKTSDRGERAICKELCR